MNKTTLLGRLTKDPAINYSNTSDPPLCIARFTLAVNRKYKKDEADFISCVCFGKLSEVIEKYVKKGDQICVAGHIQTGSYTDREGQKRYTTDVVVEDMQMCGSKAEKTQQAQAPAPQPAYEQMSLPTEPPADVPSYDEGFMKIPEGIEDELPFI